MSANDTSVNETVGNDTSIDDNSAGTGVIIVNIVFGFFLVTAIGFWVYLRKLEPQEKRSGKLEPEFDEAYDSKRFVNSSRLGSLTFAKKIPKKPTRESRQRLSMFLNTYIESNTTSDFTRLSEMHSVDLKLYKTKSNLALEDKRLTMARRKESVRLSSNMSRLNLLLGLSIPTEETKTKPSLPPKPNATRSAKDLVTDVYRHIIGKVLSSEEVRKLDIDKSSCYSSNEPVVDLENYLFRLVSGLNRWFYDGDDKMEIAGMRSLLLSLIYLKKIKKEEKDFVLTIYNVHRLFAVMMLVSAKYFEDENISNGYWAEITGIEIKELNSMEQEFCLNSGFDFFVKPSELAKIYQKFKMVYVGNMRKSKKSSLTIMSLTLPTTRRSKNTAWDSEA